MPPIPSLRHETKIRMTSPSTPVQLDTKTSISTSAENHDRSKDSGFDEFLRVIGVDATSVPDTDAASSVEGTKDGAGNPGGAPVDGALLQEAPLERPASCVERVEPQSADFMNSVNTVDSWGGDNPVTSLKSASCPNMPVTTKNPPQASAEDEDDLSDPDERKDVKQVEGQVTAEAPAQDIETAIKPAPAQGHELDEVANFINFDKFLYKDSSNYYYSQANKSVRDKLEKVKTTKTTRRSSHADFDGSAHSKSSVLSKRSTLSAYRGPQRTKSDGSAIRSVLKNRRGSDYSGNGSASFDASSIGNASARSIKRTVSFSCVNIREHERIAGDNPCVTSGVPLSIGWRSIQHPAIDLDMYEKNKGPSRDKIEMMVPADIRKDILRNEFGVSIREMNEAIKAVNISKRQRRHTVAIEHLEGWGEVLQSAKRKFGRLVKGTTTQKEEIKLWDQAHKAAMKQYLEENGPGSLGKNPEEAGSGEKGVGPLIAVEGVEGKTPMEEISYNRTDSKEDQPLQF
eukprot:CCRYP_012101-RA/>CCRYP_012101-RA protein AED:0.02 eAED:0.02 QI:381/1/1/1/0.5/0.33/3/133/513